MGSSVGIVTKLWAAQPGHGGLILGRSKRFIFLFAIGAHAASYPVGRAVTVILIRLGPGTEPLHAPLHSSFKNSDFLVAYYA